LTIKAKVKKAIEDLAKKYPQQKEIDNLINYMFAQDLSSSYGKFTKWTQHLDSSRNEKFYDSLPVFKEFENVLS
jgi:Tfp pilus assembly protein PilO